MEELDLRMLLRVFRKRLWIIVLITILSTVISGLVSLYILEPEYETYTTLMIGRPMDYKQEMKYDDVLLNQKLVSTYGEIAKSKVVANEVLFNLRLNLTYEELGEKIEVKLVKDTEIIKIIARDKDSAAAAQIANEIARVFMKHVAIIMKIENVQVIDVAEAPIKPNKPRTTMNLVIASVLAFMLSIFAVFIYEYFDNTVKTPEDIEKSIGLPVIGIVPKVTYQ